MQDATCNTTGLRRQRATACILRFFHVGLMGQETMAAAAVGCMAVMVLGCWCWPLLVTMLGAGGNGTDSNKPAAHHFTCANIVTFTRILWQLKPSIEADL
ncbi:unnamed protein product [Effrenium voratum]|uniref:Uncharacterized protein n=1 Tax=Effrenium voratum TaxID=2562239 RepID=A0AA36JS25_9DINO|nr:unnamed protein product [Effrenium voratum]CAJ1432085.1 unnamed protein product [Effrenium voratum]